MPLTIQCVHCSKSLKVSEKHIGRKVKCPGCNNVITVTAQQPPTPMPTIAAPIAATAAATATATSWRVQTPDGNKYGPISKTELDQWHAEGRLDEQCQVLQEGWTQWKYASDVYPGLNQAPAFTPPQSEIPSFQTSPDANPFAVSMSGGIKQFSDSSGEVSQGVVRALRETRPWVLFLSILGFIGCGFLAIALVFTMFTALSRGQSQLFLILLLTYGIPLALTFMSSLFLLKYSSAIQKLMISKRTSHLQQALIAQKSYWKLIGILTIITIVLYILLILLIMFAVASIAGR